MCSAGYRVPIRLGIPRRPCPACFTAMLTELTANRANMNIAAIPAIQAAPQRSASGGLADEHVQPDGCATRAGSDLDQVT